VTHASTTQPMRARRLPSLGRAAVVCGLVLAAAALVPWVGPASASASNERVTSACSTGAGVTVVVDFGPYGDVASACGADAATGLDTLESAGFSWVGTAQFSDFVCRINGLPTAAEDPCVRTPPAGAYWSYWHAARGGAWTYGSQSAATYDPAAGTVDGWAFGAGDPPGTAPPPVIPPTSQPPPPPPPTSTTPPGSEPTDPGQGDGEESASQPSTSSPSPPSGPVASVTTGSSPSESPQPSRSRPASATAVPTAGEAVPAPDGSPVGTLIGLVAAAAIAAAGGVIVLRRRQ
jgi:hypothetical protein